MTSTRPSRPLSFLALPIVLALAATAAAMGAPDATRLQPASASASACDVTLSPASRTVRRGGRVLLSGEACGANSAGAGARPVRVTIRKRNRWATLASAQAAPTGEFAICAKVRVARRAKLAQLRATTGSGSSRTTTVRVSDRGPSGCSAEAPAPAEEPAEAPAYVPPPPDQPNPACPLSQPGSNLSYTLPAACRVVGSDTSFNPDPIPFYGRVDCAVASRHQQINSGGDPRPTATGSAQGDSAYRRMTVLDGDNYWGERCELGVNDKSGPVAFYHEGQRRVTYASFRLPNSFPLSTQDWQGVMQLKQGQSSDNGGGTPVLSLGAYDNKWMLFHSEPGYTDVDEVIWEAPAGKNVWTRFAIDAKFSQYDDQGWIKVYVDLNADSDFADANEQSQTFQTNTLKHETGTDTSDGLAAGQSIPSHLRVGMYHNASIPCPGPTGCAVESDNIQVVGP